MFKIEFLLKFVYINKQLIGLNTINRKGEKY